MTKTSKEMTVHGSSFQIQDILFLYHVIKDYADYK